MSIYKTKKYENEIVSVILKYNIMTICDIFAFYNGIKSSQFYNLVLEKSESIKKAIDNNKIKTKHSIKSTMFKSGNPTMLIALYKLIGTEDEVHRLNGTRMENKNTDFNINVEI